MLPRFLILGVIEWLALIEKGSPLNIQGSLLQTIENQSHSLSPMGAPRFLLVFFPWKKKVRDSSYP